MSVVAKNCPSCGEAPSIDKSYAWHVTCGSCYDGATDACRQQHGCDLDSRDAAVESWNDQVEEYESEVADEAAADAASEAHHNACDREYDRQEEAGIDRWRGLE